MTVTREPSSRTRLRLGILGPLAATLDGDDVQLGGRRQRGVLAALLLARGHQVDADRLLHALWDGDPPPSGTAGLQAYVSHLRRALEPDRPARSPARVLVSRGSGYALLVPDEQVDAWRFEAALEQADRTDDPRERAARLQEALGLWRGRALEEYAGSAWAAAEAQRLDALRSVARERLLGARLDLGEAALVVPEAEALLAEDPLHEARWRLLGVALYRAHRQADALAAVRRARELLAEELGVDPGPGLRTLEAELLAQSPSLDAPQPAPVAVPEVLLPEVPVAAEEAAPAASAEDLVDREQELRRLRACFDEAMAGRPRVAVIEGPAGIGKSRLLQEVRQRAAARGATVLSARGSQLEREFGFGAVRQLFEPALAVGPDGLLVGAAAAAGRVFDVGVGETPRGESLFSALHGLYWMTVNLAERGPLVLAVDDVQWCDSGSLRFLGYLARRLGGLRLLVVATLRSGEQHVEEDLLHDLAGDAEVLRPSPLTLAGVSGLVHARLPGADEAFVGACFRTTGGNPLLLRQLLSALEAEHVRPDASHADTVRAIGSRAVSSLVLMRLGRLPVAARDVARAVSVLGDGASLPAVAALTGLGEPETARATATLARADVLRPDLPLGFVHPLVGDAVYGDLPLGERELMHERAARVLTDAGASAEQVAAHLMLVPARGDDGVVEVLREAAARDVARGATEGAIAYLLRAVAEPPAPEDLPLLLLDLGRLESMVDGPAAAEHLGTAYRLLTDPVHRADAAIMLARTAVFVGGRGDAARIATAALADLEGYDASGLADRRQHLVALARVGAYMHGLVDDFDTAGPPVPPVDGVGPGARALSAELAWEELCRGTDRARAAELARFAVADRTLQEADPGLLWVVAAIVLEMTGTDTTAFWEDELGHAYRTGGLFTALAVHLWLGYVQWHQGDLRESLQSMAHCTEQNEQWGADHVGQPYTDAFMVSMLLDRGDVPAAREMLELARDRPRVGEGVRLYGEVEAAVLRAEGDPAGALRVLDSVRDAMAVVANPAWRPWRSRRAEALAALGRREEAVALVTEELAAARRWGAPAVVGRALRVLGEVARDADALREAAEELGRSSRRFELARARLALGRLLAEQAGPLGEEAREALLEAVALADTCAADGLRREAVAVLDRAGVAVPSLPPERVRLTAAETRIATMAVDGLPQTEIAQALFITCSTVQTIVESVSARLGAGTLDELRSALARL